ncbi:MAG: hypothetical protein WC940_02735 [Candidatus Paceibacterota bacterium]|jgi:hypothetical protein
MRKQILQVVWDTFLDYFSGDEGSKQLTTSTYRSNFDKKSYLVTILVEEIKNN